MSRECVIFDDKELNSYSPDDWVTISSNLIKMQTENLNETVKHCDINKVMNVCEFVVLLLLENRPKLIEQKSWMKMYPSTICKNIS